MVVRVGLKSFSPAIEARRFERIINWIKREVPLMERMASDNNINANLSEEEMFAIQTIIMDHFCVSREQVTPEARLVEDFIADSLDMIEITMMLEERFCLAFPDAKAEQIKTAADIYDLVAAAQKEAKMRSLANPAVAEER
jgi:acyl carrier protein